MSNILKAFLNIVNNYQINITNVTQGNNRANNMGEGLETYIKDIFANTTNENLYNHTLRYKQNSESAIMNEKYVATKIKSVSSRNIRNLDIIYLNNRYYCEAGYMDSLVDAKKGSYHFYSYSLEGSYFLIGQGKRFNTKESKFSKIKTTRGGALELALRYSFINLNDKDRKGGKQSDYNVALNWYLTTEFKMMFNYIRALPQGTQDYNGVINIYQMRLLFAF